MTADAYGEFVDYEGYEDAGDTAGEVNPSLPWWVYSRSYRGERADAGRLLGNAPAGAMVGRILSSIEKKAHVPRGTSRALKVWRELSDERVTKHVTGVFLRVGKATRELVAYVDASPWMYEFTMYAPSLLQEWNALCEAHGLELKANKLTFRLARHAKEAGHTGTLKTFGEEGERAPVPLTAEELASVERTVAAVGDERLRRYVSDAMIRTLERKKANQGQNGA